MLVEHFPVSVGVFLGIVVSVVGIFIFSMPAYRSPIDRTMLDFSAQHHHSAADVRRAFSLRGLTLSRATGARTGVTLSGGTAGLNVFVGKRSLDRSTRPPAGYEKRLGNILVRYGGADQGVLVRVQAAVAALAG